MPRIGSLTLGGRPRIVAAGGEADLEALAAARDADVLELRADLFSTPTPAAIVAALGRLRSAGRPLLLTVRAGAEGGRAMPEDQRRALYEAGLPHADAIDLEIASLALVHDVGDRARAQGRTLLLSAHFLAATPSRVELLALVDRGGALGADVVKLAAYAQDLDDVRTLLGVTLAARDRGVVTMSMGEVGALSRVFFPAAGSLLTYGCVGAPTAPGQLPVEELARLVHRFYPA